MDKKKLESELAKIFKSSSYQSFKRQLSLYGFTRIGKQHKIPCFVHPCFKKNEKELMSSIKREKQYKIVKAIKMNTKKLEYILHRLRIIRTLKGRPDLKIQKELDLLESLYRFRKLFGRSIMVFVLRFLDGLTRLYPNVIDEHMEEVFSTIRLLKEKTIKSARTELNQREISTKLINKLLDTLYAHYSSCDYGAEFKEQLKFNNSLIEFERDFFNFEKQKPVKKEKKTIFTDSNTISEDMIFFENPSNEKECQSHEENITLFENSDDDLEPCMEDLVRD